MDGSCLPLGTESHSDGPKLNVDGQNIEPNIEGLKIVAMTEKQTNNSWIHFS